MNEIAHTPQLTFWHDPVLGGLDFMKAQYPSTYQFERHIHDDLVITVTEKGAGNAKSRHISDLAGPGTIWVSGMGDYHSGTVIHEQGWNYRAIYLGKQALQSVKNVFQKQPSGTFTIPPGIYFDPQIAHLLTELHIKVEAEAPLLERQTLWWSAIGLFFGRYGQARPETEAVNTEHTKMNVIRDYMAANYQKNITIEELSKLSDLSHYHFIRVFGREFGLPPHAYINQLRLAAAKRFLGDGQLPANVAVDVGLYDQSHLNRLFKKCYGITPGAYAQAKHMGLD